MNTRDSSFHQICHRCDRPMVLHSVEVVDGGTVEVFRCELCNTLEAVKIEKAA